MSHANRILVAALAASLVAGAAAAETVKLKTSLDGATEVPPVTSEGKGTATLSLDTASKKLSYTVEYSGLSGPATMAHIHGPAAPGANAGVVVPLTSTPSPLKGEVTLTDAQIADLLAGKDYINIHTAAHPSGEIRGYVSK
ncbi:MAG TPA: CHRD domain-containing protein [Stellaceae bacterium]|nr:CHRD domain-containing protein [Stellaceae bacterium]